MPGSRADATRAHWLGVLAKYKQEGSGPDARGMWSPSLDAASRDEIRAIQNAKLAALTPFLYENSAFYRRRFDRLGPAPSDIRSVDDLPKWPVVEIDADSFLLEYDTPRAGDFAPLRFLGRGKGAGLGLISSKSPKLESITALCRRVDEAAKKVTLERLAISPQCGFASTVAGNPVSPGDQRRKLALVVEVARRVWGSPPRSVRHQDRHRHVPQDLARGPTQDELAHA